MLRITPNKSSQGALTYFDDGLSKPDYYSEDNKSIGLWGGIAASHLNLSGEVDRSAFAKLCKNINPAKSGKLTLRTRADRTVLYDFTFSSPKSLSLVFSQTRDNDILMAFNKAISETMFDIEKEAQTRVRANGKNENRITGNLVWAAFTHEEARPVDGIPDPHLHQHVCVFNATFDKIENKWKAAQFRNLKANAPFFETLFHSRLASNLRQAGYTIERNERDFELKGFQRVTIDKFSNRTKEVNDRAEKLGITSDKAKDKIGAKTRANKKSGLDKKTILKTWQSRLTHEEIELIHQSKKVSSVDRKKEITANNALEYSISHCLERKSVVEHKELLIHALKRSTGSQSKESIENEIINHKNLLSKETLEGKLYTTYEAVAEEKRLIAETRSGRGKYTPINPKYKIKNAQLTTEQKEAVLQVLNSKDFITIIAGRAGTGKTWTVQEISKGANENGISFHAFAPSAEASRKVQRLEGFQDATTVSELLLNARSQENLKNGVLWVDEAGLVGNQTMNSIIDLAKRQNARILLTGDTRQHGAIERGDALRIMQSYGGIKPMYLTKIKRQQEQSYREAIKSISDGKIFEGYKMLEEMEAIKEASDMDQLKENVAKEYCESRKSQENALIVATTHFQGMAVTKAIREKLKAEGAISTKEKVFTIQNNLSFTGSQKSDLANFQPGQTVQFHQNVKGGFKRGAVYDIDGKDEQGNILISEKSIDPEKKIAKCLPLNSPKAFSIYEKEEIPIAKGDQIRITKNGFSNENKRLNNGDILTVKGIDKQGNITVSTGKNEITLDKSFGNFTHGYYTTSPSSQGKSVNRVIIMQGSASGKAASQEQFYVSASRGKFAISVHTDDKEQLLLSVQKSSSRMTAMEIADTKNSEIVQAHSKENLSKENFEQNNVKSNGYEQYDETFIEDNGKSFPENGFEIEQ